MKVEYEQQANTHTNDNNMINTFFPKLYKVYKVFEIVQLQKKIMGKTI